ncbi:hypothetical protein [Comamonas testosteroni]|uniref:hypothetical protein n=1 Tax=Comamonas testosteroni TaxID=285 RepID=UPI002DB6D2C7|nr:hypothetical protein [Comamonas testosteroni]MEB5967373.1 hypothetical protein [Comamonas testosteroni]
MAKSNHPGDGHHIGDGRERSQTVMPVGHHVKRGRLHWGKSVGRLSKASSRKRSRPTMPECLVGCFLANQRRLVYLGGTLVPIGGLLLVAAFVEQMKAIVSAFVKGLDGGAPVEVALSDELPGYRSFRMSVSVIGFALAILLLAARLILARTGPHNERHLVA